MFGGFHHLHTSFFLLFHAYKYRVKTNISKFFYFLPIFCCVNKRNKNEILCFSLKVSHSAAFRSFFPKCKQSKQDFPIDSIRIYYLYKILYTISLLFFNIVFYIIYCLSCLRSTLALYLWGFQRKQHLVYSCLHLALSCLRFALFDHFANFVKILTF